MEYGAILFDIDGTLIALDGVVKAMQKTFRKMKLKPLTKNQILHNIVGYSLSERFAEFYPQCPWREEEFVDTYHKIYKRIPLKSSPYAKQVLEMVKKKKFKIGLVSTKHKVDALYALKAFKLKYDVLISQDDVKHRKPDPEPVFKACEKLKVKPEDCMMIGDHTFDMIAAKEAGCFPVGILTGVGKEEELRKAGAGFVIKNLKGLVKLLNLGD